MTDPSHSSLIRVVVADAHPLFTLGVRTLLSQERQMQVVGEACSGEEALRLLERIRPDVLLLDLALQRISALELLSRISALKLPTRTVVLTRDINGSELRTALVRGAHGVLLKHTENPLLAKCIRQVMKGEYWIGRDNVGELVDALRKSAKADSPASRLSHREKDIVRAVLKGASNKDIAWQLGLGEQTVKNHLRRIFSKVGVANRVELAVHALAHHIASERETA